METIRIKNRQELISMLRPLSSSRVEGVTSTIESTLFEYRGVRVLRITTQPKVGLSTEIWMVEDTSFTWDELAAVIERNSLAT